MFKDSANSNEAGENVEAGTNDAETVNGEVEVAEGICYKLWIVW